jgi:hypothetical protein
MPAQNSLLTLNTTYRPSVEPLATTKFIRRSSSRIFAPTSLAPSASSTSTKRAAADVAAGLTPHGRGRRFNPYRAPIYIGTVRRAGSTGQSSSLRNLGDSMSLLL